MTTLPFKRHPAQPIVDLILWILFLLTAILALGVELGFFGDLG